MKSAFLAGLVSLGLLAAGANAQEGYKNDVTVSALGAFQQSTSGNGLNQSRSGDNAGVLFSYRYFFTDHQGLELNYGFSRYNQDFSALTPSPSLPVSLGVPANTNEATLSYVARFGTWHRLRPFVTAGTGALVFTPVNSFSFTGVNGGTFATPDFVYGAGADVALSRRVSLRLGYRGHVFNAPDFGIATLHTGSVTHMAEPFGGISFHF